MGQHKFNPNSQLAKDGKLPPKPPKKSKRQCERELRALCYDYLVARSGLGLVNGNDGRYVQTKDEEF